MGTVSDGAEGTRMRLSPLARQLHFFPQTGTDETGTDGHRSHCLSLRFTLSTFNSQLCTLRYTLT